MTTIGDNHQSGRAWGVAAIPGRTVTTDAASPDPNPLAPAPSVQSAGSGEPVTTVTSVTSVASVASVTSVASVGPVAPVTTVGPVTAVAPRHRAADRAATVLAEPPTGIIGVLGLPEREPPREHKRAPSRFWTGLRTAVVVVVLVAGAATGGYLLLRQRMAAAAFVDLGTVTLTADPVPIGLADSAVVVSVSVAAQDRVEADQEVAQVRAANNDITVLRAPSAGAVASVNVGPGGLVRGGEPVIVLYDPERTTFQAAVPVESLQRLRIGMSAQISGPGLSAPIPATLDHVVPVMNMRPTGELTVVLVPAPERRPDVARLLPGLPFSATVDTNSAATSVPAVNAG